MPKFITKEQSDQIISAIKAAEKNCSGEIRVHFDSHCNGDVLDTAARTFARLKMQRTKLRNGVLFYVAFEDRQFAVIGDKGINSKVPENFWNGVCDILTEHFKENDFAGGLSKGIELCGEQLKKFFPYQDDDVNELPDDISFGK